MTRKYNKEEYLSILRDHNISKLYHFTDFDNLESIIKNGGLYSWADCKAKGIITPKPGGSSQSHDLDQHYHLDSYVRLSFTMHHPMMYVAMNDGRISNPVILEIDPDVISWEDTLYSDRNAVKNGFKVGGSLSDFHKIRFDLVNAKSQFDIDEEDRMFYQAEVLVKSFIPLKAILNIGNFGIKIPTSPKLLQNKIPYTAQITRNTPTAFIFLVDHSVSMTNWTSLYGEKMSMSKAVSIIVNKQINELVLRCIKTNEVRHYYDIAVVGYGQYAYSAWEGKLKGRDFVTPQELRDNPYKKIVVKEPKKTRKGVIMKEVERVQWIEPRHDGSWTHFHEAFDYAHRLLDNWMEEHHEQDCYPPTIIHITDGEFNNSTKEEVLQKANELKSMFTNDGNVLLFNIHISSEDGLSVLFPLSKNELSNNEYGRTLYEMSSLLPLRYNKDISSIKDDDQNQRHSAMAVNADMTTLIRLMDIGTPTNIGSNCDE